MPTPDQQTTFRELLQRNQARWIGVARAYAAPEDRDDLLQEIALQVWKSLAGFRGDASSDTWSYRVALNTALAWRRRTKTRSDRITRSLDDVNLLPSAGDDGGEQRVAALLDRFLASLNKADRAVMLLHLDGVTPTEAADVLGISPGSYRTRMHRVRRRFEEEFCQEEGER